MKASPQLVLETHLTAATAGAVVSEIARAASVHQDLDFTIDPVLADGPDATIQAYVAVPDGGPVDWFEVRIGTARPTIRRMIDKAISAVRAEAAGA